MPKAQLVITAITVEKRSVSEAARSDAVVDLRAAGFRSRGSAVKTRRGATGARQFGVDLARHGIQGRVGTPDPPAAQGPP